MILTRGVRNVHFWRIVLVLFNIILGLGGVGCFISSFVIAIEYTGKKLPPTLEFDLPFLLRLASPSWFWGVLLTGLGYPPDCCNGAVDSVSTYILGIWSWKSTLVNFSGKVKLEPFNCNQTVAFKILLMHL